MSQGAPGRAAAAAESQSRSIELALSRSLLYEFLSVGFSPETSGGEDPFAAAGALEALEDAAECLDSEPSEDRSPIEETPRDEADSSASELRGDRSPVRSETASKDETSPPAPSAASGPAEAGGPLAALLAPLAARLAAEAGAARARERQRLFGHTVRGSVSPYETEYGDDALFQRPQELADIAGFLRAFGLAVEPAVRERIDHLSCELEFLALLARKEAHAVEIGDVAMRDATRGATRLFLKDHLARFVPAFNGRVQRAAPDGFHAALSALCLAFVGAECRRFGVSLGPPMLRLRLDREEPFPAACGDGEGAPAGAGKGALDCGGCGADSRDGKDPEESLPFGAPRGGESP